MRKLNFILLYIWSALAFAAASKAQVNRPFGEWLKVGIQVVKQQPVSFELGHVWSQIDPEGRWLHTAAAIVA
jgi:hypothetical protein